MTSKSNKLRAVFLTALMIGSVFAAGIAFTGTAAAGAAALSNVDDSVAAGNDLSFDATDSGSGANNITVWIDENNDGYVNSSEANTTISSGNFGTNALEVPSDLSDGTYTLAAVSNSTTGTGTADATVDFTVDSTAPSIRKATHYDNGTDDGIIEIAFDENVTTTSSTTVDIGYADGSVVTNASALADADNDGRLVVTATDVDGTGVNTDVVNVTVNGVNDTGSNNAISETTVDVTVAPATLDAAASASTEEYVGTNVALKGNLSDSFEIAGPSVSRTRGAGTGSQVYVFNTDGVDTGTYNVTTEGGDGQLGTLTLDDLGLSVSADASSFTTDDAVTATAESDDINRQVQAVLLDSNGDETDYVASGEIDSDGQVTLDFGQVAAEDVGDYTVQVTDVQSGVSAESGSFEVTEAADTSTEFVSSTDTTRGDLGTITVSLTNTETATVNLGGSGVGYQANFTVVDGNADGEVTVTINTYTMGNNVSDAFYVAGDSDDSVDSVDFRYNALSNPIASGSYRTTVRAGGTASDQAQDISRFSIDAADGVTGQNIWTAPGSTEAANLLGAVSQDDSIASGDWIVHEIEANGVFGVLQNASTESDTQALLNAVNQSELSLSVVQTDTSTRQNRDQKTLDYTQALIDGDATVIADAENDTVYVAADLAAVDASPRDLEFGNDVYNASVTLNATTTGLTSADTTAYAEFSAAQRSSELANDEYTVEAADNQSITAETSAADGTQFNVVIESVESPGEGYIISDNLATAEDGTITFNVNFSEAAVNSTFDVTLEDVNGQELDTATGDVVESQQQTTTAPTTTAPTTTAPTTTEETTTVETTTEPTTTEQTTEQTTEEQTTEEQMDTTTEEDESGGGIPGFGMGIALLAIIGAAFLALRQN